MKNKIAARSQLGLLILTFLAGSIVAFAQGTPAHDLSGTYEGTLKHAGQPEQKVSLELKNEGGKISGRAIHGKNTIDSSDAKFENGTLSLTFGEAVLIVKVDGDKLVGNLVMGTEKHPVELKKVTAAAAVPVNLNGEWDGVADANGQPFPFLLMLKVEGENVSGGSSSQLGESSIKNGSWKDGKLAFQLEGQNGTITMSATVVEGKLSGDFDYAGQLQGKWVAVKKN